MKTADQLFAAMQKAVAHHQGGRLLEAEQFYLDVLKTNHLHFDALRLLGGLYIQNNQNEKARVDLEKAFSLQPDNAELSNNLGVILYRLEKWDEAIAHYQQAIHLKPDYQEARNNLANLLFEYGNQLRNAGKSEEAFTVYRQLIELQPGDTKILLNLGMIFHDMGNFDKALEQFDAILELQPSLTDALINRGSLLLELDRPDEANVSFSKALQLQPDLRDAKWGKALASLMIGEYRVGWSLYETRFERTTMRDAVPFQSPQWDGRAFPGKRLLIWAEQGLGDTLQFIRYAALCKEKGGTVIVMCPAPLVRLLKNCPFIDDAVTSATESDFDDHIPIMSLPRIFGTTVKTIPQNVPYLFVSDEARQKGASHFASVDGFKVGLVWAGNPRKGRIDAHITDRQRSMNLDQLKPLFEVSPCRFYSLQMGDGAQEMKTSDLGDRLIDYTADVTDFMDTAAIIENLDLVISVDTSVVHLTGGLGKPVWVMSRFGGCWRWLRNQEINPWYPTARVFSQSTPGDWTGCIDKISAALKSEAGA